MALRTTGFVLLGCLAATACAPTGPGTATTVGNASNVAPSGITASNGGAQRQLNDIPSVSVGQGGAVTGSVPNTKGNSY